MTSIYFSINRKVRRVQGSPWVDTELPHSQERIKCAPILGAVPPRDNCVPVEQLLPDKEEREKTYRESWGTTQAQRNR